MTKWKFILYCTSMLCNRDPNHPDKYTGNGKKEIPKEKARGGRCPECGNYLFSKKVREGWVEKIRAHRESAGE